jgi:molybdate transport system ATP-binding protein
VLRATVRLRRGALSLDVDLTVGDGEVVALLGPNGAGKTTTLRAVAGLEPLQDGRIELDGDVLDEPARRTFVPPRHRQVGVVFQDPLLFPHLSALENVAFGLRSRGTAKAAARAEALRLLERVGLADRAGARPAALSGGEAQRVAVARALAPAPRLLLLDEPLSALDATKRAELRAELRAQLRAVPGARLLVTHDPVDAAVLADRVVILERGRVVQEGTTAHVVAHPVSRFVADLAGVNLLLGRRVGTHVVRLDTGAELTSADPVPAVDAAVAVRPQAVALHRARPEGSPRNAWAATVVGLEGHGDRLRVQLTGAVALTAEVTPAAVADLGLAPGEEVWASVKAVDLTVYPR